MIADQAWFELRDVRRKRANTSVWIALRRSEIVVLAGEEGQVGYQEDVICNGTVAFTENNRELAERLGWSDLGLGNSPEPYAFAEGRYKPADVYQYHDGEDAGIHLVVGRNWMVNQDLILALDLVKEGNQWVRPSEGYVEVIRERRANDGRVRAIEIKTEFLRDYLAARGLALRIATFRERTAILNVVSGLPNWKEEPVLDNAEHERLEVRMFEVDEKGWPLGNTAVMRMWRTDVDSNDDVPILGPDTDANTEYTHEVIPGRVAAFTRVSGSLWREEWLEAADRSERVRRDDSLEEFFYAVEADGGRMSGRVLNSEDIGRWLWFRPNVIPELLSRRDGALSWYSELTGQVQCSAESGTHFGVNSIGLINIYAYDIAKLPIWQQRIWAGHNVTPDGGVSAELLASQGSSDPADTSAPETRFVKLREMLNAVSHRSCGTSIFRRHESEAEILNSIHRFRSLDRGGLLALAKDLARLTADSIDTGALAQIVRPTKTERWGSLKHLEKAIASISEAQAARDAVGRLVGIYELRLGDAHLPSSKIQDAFALAGVDPTDSYLRQGMTLIDSAAQSFWLTGRLIHRHVNQMSQPCPALDGGRDM